jgi:hypothetical protein
MRTLLLLAALVITVIAAVVLLTRPTQTAQVALDDITMTLAAGDEPFAIGETQLVVTLMQADGTPIDDAELQVVGNMDHAGMIPVERAVRGGEAGRYTVPFEWTMGGGWIVTVTATLPDNGGQISRDFEFFVEAVSRQSIINQTPQPDPTPAQSIP